MDPHVATLLGEVLERLHRAPDRRDVLRALADAVCALMPCKSALVWAQSARHRALKPRAASPDTTVPAELANSSIALALVEARLGERRSLHVAPSEAAGAHDLALVRSALAAQPTDDVIVLPLVHRGGIEGLVSCRLEAGSADPTAAWEQVAPHIALVLNATRLHETGAAMRSYRNHFATLGADVLTAPDAETTAVRICELTRTLFSTTRSALFLLEGPDLVPVAAAGPYGDRATGGKLHVPPGVEPGFDEALRTRQVLVINAFRSSSYAETPIPLPFRPQAAMVMPLTDAVGTIGLLTASDLDDPYRFGPDAAEHGRLLSAVATVAMRRMLLVEELQRAGRAKDEFLATVSHELRTPINVVLGYVQLLTEQTFGPMSAEQLDTMGRIERGARSLLALVDDLLDLARVERGAIACERRAVSLAPLFDELGDAARALIGARPIRFSSTITGSPVALTDPDRLRQVLLNVVGNSVKFTAQGSIDVRAWTEGERVVVEVADTGSGMEPAFLGRATEPFVRGDTSTGSGLGLAIVARVLRVLDGDLAIDSSPGEGTTLRILVPAAAAAAHTPSNAS
ncbi:GAF domain-containing protein [Candidatus Binatia bacterium]|nr:GAF domain-containing protein [Candidatus Binatia bacterium]